MRGYILLCFLILAYGQPQDDFQTAMISKHECKVIEKSQEFQNFVQVPLFLKTKLTMAALLLEVKMEKHGVQPMLTQEQTNISLMATFLVNALTRIVYLQN